MHIQLRPYQVESVQSVRRDWDDGYTDVLVVAATGLGKTQIFCEILDQEIRDTNRRALVLAHRNELVAQPEERLLAYWPHWFGYTGTVRAARRDVGAQIIFGSMQTLKDPERLDELLSVAPIDLLIIDEAHHAWAESYQTIIESLKADNPNMLHLGVTATPVRSDGGALGDIYQKTSAIYDIRFGVVNSFLVPPKWLAISSGVSLKGVATKKGEGGKDFAPGQLSERFETERTWRLVVEAHQKFAAGRRGIAFTVTVKGAHELAKALNAAGITAVAVDGSAKDEERASILQRFRAGEIEILVNCQLFTEGLDIPEVSVIHMARPTQSDSLYLQCIGRGLRPAAWAQKEDCLILDYAPADRQVVMLGDVLLGDDEASRAIRNASRRKKPEEAEPGEVTEGFLYDGAFRGLGENEPLELVARQLNYLEKSPWRWERDGQAMYLDLGPDKNGNNRILWLTEPGRIISPTQKLLLVTRPKEGRGQVETLAEGEQGLLLEQASVYAEQHANVVLARRAAHWRNEPATEGQMKYLKSLKVKVKPAQILTKGEAARLITLHTSKQMVMASGYW